MTIIKTTINDDGDDFVNSHHLKIWYVIADTVPQCQLDGDSDHCDNDNDQDNDGNNYDTSTLGKVMWTKESTKLWLIFMAADGATASIALFRPLGQNIATPFMIDRNNDHHNYF